MFSSSLQGRECGEGAGPVRNPSRSATAERSTAELSIHWKSSTISVAATNSLIQLCRLYAPTPSKRYDAVLR